LVKRECFQQKSKLQENSTVAIFLYSETKTMYYVVASPHSFNITGWKSQWSQLCFTVWQKLLPSSSKKEMDFCSIFIYLN